MRTELEKYILFVLIYSPESVHKFLSCMRNMKITLSILLSKHIINLLKTVLTNFINVNLVFLDESNETLLVGLG